MPPIKRERSPTPDLAPTYRAVRPRQTEAPAPAPGAPVIPELFTINLRGELVTRPRYRFPEAAVHAASAAPNHYLNLGRADFDLYENVVRNRRVSPRLSDDSVLRLKDTARYIHDQAVLRDIKNLLPQRRAAHASKGRPQYQREVLRLADMLEAAGELDAATRKRARMAALPNAQPMPDAPQAAQPQERVVAPPQAQMAIQPPGQPAPQRASAERASAAATNFQSPLNLADLRMSLDRYRDVYINVSQTELGAPNRRAMFAQLFQHIADFKQLDIADIWRDLCLLDVHSRSAQNPAEIEAFTQLIGAYKKEYRTRCGLTDDISNHDFFATTHEDAMTLEQLAHPSGLTLHSGPNSPHTKCFLRLLMANCRHDTVVGLNRAALDNIGILIANRGLIAEVWQMAPALGTTLATRASPQVASHFARRGVGLS